MLNKQRKEQYRKREKKLSKNDKKHAEQSEKKREQNTHMYASWNFVRKLCLQVDLRFAFTLFYR